MSIEVNLILQLGNQMHVYFPNDKAILIEIDGFFSSNLNSLYILIFSMFLETVDWTKIRQFVEKQSDQGALSRGTRSRWVKCSCQFFRILIFFVCCFDVAIIDLVHNVGAIFHLSQLLTASGNL